MRIGVEVLLVLVLSLLVLSWVVLRFFNGGFGVGIPLCRRFRETALMDSRIPGLREIMLIEEDTWWWLY